MTDSELPELPTLMLRLPDGAKAGQWFQLNTSGGPTNVKIQAEHLGEGEQISVKVLIKPPEDGTPLRLADLSAWPKVKDIISERIIPIKASESESESNAMTETEHLVSKMPADLKAASLPEFGTVCGRAFEDRDDCKTVLDEITRAVPMKMLFNHGEGSLHKADDKAKLRASHFFLSEKVSKSKLRGFVSHRWNADPQDTAEALMLHYKMRFFLLVILFLWMLMVALVVGCTGCTCRPRCLQCL
jgi:hypothetical protein